MAKILHISKYYLPFCGGVEGVVKSLSEAAVENSHQVRVLCASHGPSLLEEETISKVRVYRFKTLFHFASQPIALGYFFKLREHLKWADIVYVHSPNPLAEIATMLLASRQVKILILHHCDIVKQKFLKKIFAPFQRMFYKRANKIIVATENHIKYSNICLPFEQKCEIIPFGFEVPKVSANNLNLKGKVYALFVGRLVGYKGLHVLIKSFKKIDGILYIVGTGPLEEDLIKLRDSLSLQEKVIFTGRVTDQDLAAYYQDCRCLVLPSVSEAENFGLVQVEAMSYKKPVIATSLKSGASTIVLHELTGYLVPPNNGAILEEKIRALFSSNELARLLGEAGFQRYLEHYSYESMKVAHEDLVKSIIGLKNIWAEIDTVTNLKTID